MIRTLDIYRTLDSKTPSARERASNGVHVPAVAALLPAVWAGSQEGELAERQESVPGVVLPAAWVFGLGACTPMIAQSGIAYAA